MLAWPILREAFAIDVKELPVTQPIIVWFRQDLRLDDNMAVAACVEAGAPMIALFIDDRQQGRQAGAVSLWWRDQSLRALANDLQRRGSQLIFRQGDAASQLNQLIDETKAQAVFWNRQYDAESIARDTAIKADLQARQINAESFNATLLFEPWEIRSKTANTPFKVFTPFWNACQAHGIDARVWDAPKQFLATNVWPQSHALTEAAAPEGAEALDQWQPGEDGARKALRHFLNENIHGYADGRDFPAKPATSRLAPHLRWGEISPRRLFAETAAARVSANDQKKFFAEIGWREFSYQTLFHNPDLKSTCLQPKFEPFPWREGADAEADFEAWKSGNTGYPIVDAGMRELRQTGYMHNRVRMIAASFLIKHLLIDWRRGEAWFWERLADADPANNTASWQWVAGCGADAAPYFRIFNPIIQGQKFDPDGQYTKRYVPELNGLSGKMLFSPWLAKSDLLENANIQLGQSYPAPIVEHDFARNRALDIFKALA